MNSYDDIIKMMKTISSFDEAMESMKKRDHLLSSVRNFEQISGHNIQQNIIEEHLERERMLKSAIPELSTLYSNAIESLQPSIAQLYAFESHSPAMSSLLEAHNSLSHLLSSQTDLDIMTKLNTALNPCWEETIKSYSALVDLPTATELSLKSHYSYIAESALLAQERLLLVPWDSIGNATKINPPAFLGIRDCFVTLTDKYSTLIHSFVDKDNRIATFPPIVSGGPPIEILTSACVLDALSNPIIHAEHLNSEQQIEYRIEKDIEASIDELLVALDHRLHNTWLGAKEALGSNNSDRKRHVVVSLRELVTHVLHALAPDDEVHKWTTNPKHFHEGHPTRAARVLYVCREVNHGPFTNFISADVKATLEFITLFQRGTHELDIVFSENQLRTLVTRTESLLRFLLLTYRETN